MWIRPKFQDEKCESVELESYSHYGVNWDSTPCREDGGEEEGFTSQPGNQYTLTKMWW